MSKKKEKMLGTLFAFIGGSCWGFSGTCGQFLFSHKGVSAEWLTSVRMLFAGIIMVFIAVTFQRKNVKSILSNKYDRIVLVIFGILGLMLCQYTYFAAISHSNAATATVLQYLGPALIMIYICFRSLRFPNRREILAVILAVSGTFLLATHGNIHNLAISPMGLTFGLLSALTLAIYSLIPGKIISRYGSITVTGFGMLIAGIVFTLIIRTWKIPQELDFGTVFITVVIILIGTVLPFTLYLQGVSFIGASKASMIACVEPVSATFFSAVLLKERFTAIDILGFAFIIFTVLLLSFKDTKSADNN